MLSKGLSSLVRYEDGKLCVLSNCFDMEIKIKDSKITIETPSGAVELSGELVADAVSSSDGVVEALASLGTKLVSQKASGGLLSVISDIPKIMSMMKDASSIATMVKEFLGEPESVDYDEDEGAVVMKWPEMKVVLKTENEEVIEEILNAFGYL